MSVENGERALPTASQLEDVFHAALKASDLDGVIAALHLMARVDPHRAARLMDDLQTAVHLAKRLSDIAAGVDTTSSEATDG